MATPQKTEGIGQLIQSQLSNPPTTQFYCLEQLCNQSIAHLILKYQVLKNQPAKHGTAGILFASSTRAWGYNLVTDDGKETIPLAAPPTLQETIPHSADETDTVMAPTLPESFVEVAPC